jgi:SecD/SecF fusion protein
MLCAWSGTTLASDRLVLEILDAQPEFGAGNYPVVNFRLSRKSRGEFGEWTARYVGRTIRLYANDRLLVSPRLMSPITGGSGQVSVSSTGDAEDLARQLRDGNANLSVDVKD